LKKWQQYNITEPDVVKLHSPCTSLYPVKGK
jgi:hypothetical protein